jgi:integrase/recombinase XerD
MAGPRKNLSEEEIFNTLQNFHGEYALRDKCLFIFMLRTGFRISEALSLQVKDVYQQGYIVDQVNIPKSKMKKKQKGRTVWLHQEAKVYLGAWLQLLGTEDSKRFIFISKKRGRREGFVRKIAKPISRIQGWQILKAAFAKAGVRGATGTHSCRKTFAAKVFAFTGKDLQATKNLLGHESITSTEKYLQSTDETVKNAFLKS